MIAALALLALGSQSLLMLVDEFHFHRARRLPRWERVGHPLDTLSVLACYAIALLCSAHGSALYVYAAAAVFSCLFVTKDELVHAKLCTPGEHWLHALLFVLHPTVLALTAALWLEGFRAFIAAQASLTFGFLVYQIAYWNLPWKTHSLDR